MWNVKLSLIKMLIGSGWVMIGKQYKLSDENIISLAYMGLLYQWD